jgi:SAM-dependent methyltransferase
MRQGIRDLVGIVSETLLILEPIYEFGALQSQAEGFSDLRPFFAGKEYIGCDIRQGSGVDRIMDLHATGLPSESVGTVMLLETLEHVQFPMKAMEEVYRILKPNGIVVMSSQMNYPIHDVHDYWRFTPEAFLTLLRDFPLSFVESAGDPSFPPAVVGVGVKGQLPAAAVEEFRNRIGEWKRSWNHASTTEGFPKNHWKDFVKLFIPPILLELYRRLR